jgi:hypothetical protein
MQIQPVSFRIVHNRRGARCKAAIVLENLTNLLPFTCVNFEDDSSRTNLVNVILLSVERGWVGVTREAQGS